MPSSQHLQDENARLVDTIQSGDLKFLRGSKKSTHSIDQPGHGTCVLAASGKWTWDSNLLSRMSTTCDILALPALVKLNDYRVRIIAVMHSHACIDGDSAHQCFNEILSKAQPDERSAVLYADSGASHQLSGIY